MVDIEMYYSLACLRSALNTAISTQLRTLPPFVVFMVPLSLISCVF